MFKKKFDSSKCKTALRLTVCRVNLLKNKINTQLQLMRKDVANLLQNGQDTSARIRVEHVMREQNTIVAYDIIELFCELLAARLSIIESQKQCPQDLREAIGTLIFASSRCADIPELLDICKIFKTKYGKEFVSGAAELRPDCKVNRTIIEKLSVKTPSGDAKLKIMKEIANEFKVDWDSKEVEEELLKTKEDLLDGPNKFSSATNMQVGKDSTYPETGNRQNTFSPNSQDLNDFTKLSFEGKSFDDMNRRSSGTGWSNGNNRNLSERCYQTDVKRNLAEQEPSPSKKFPHKENGNPHTQFTDAEHAAQVASEYANKAVNAAKAAAFSARQINSFHEQRNFSSSGFDNIPTLHQSISMPHRAYPDMEQVEKKSKDFDDDYYYADLAIKDRQQKMEQRHSFNSRESEDAEEDLPIRPRNRNMAIKDRQQKMEQHHSFNIHESEDAEEDLPIRPRNRNMAIKDRQPKMAQHHSFNSHDSEDEEDALPVRPRNRNMATKDRQQIMAQHHRFNIHDSEGEQEALPIRPRNGNIVYSNNLSLPIFDESEDGDSYSGSEMEMQHLRAEAERRYQADNYPPSKPPPSHATSFKTGSSSSLFATAESVNSSFDSTNGSGSHVHPRLPDYESLAARFEALKYNKR